MKPDIEELIQGAGKAALVINKINDKTALGLNPTGTSPAKVILFSSSFVLNSVLITSGVLSSSFIFKGNLSPLFGKSAAYSPKYFLYKSRAGCPSIS
jgi:hypothetical protein